MRRRMKPRDSSSWSEIENLLTVVWDDEAVTFRVGFSLRRREGRGVVGMMPRRIIALGFSCDFVGSESAKAMNVI